MEYVYIVLSAGVVIWVLGKPFVHKCKNTWKQKF